MCVFVKLTGQPLEMKLQNIHVDMLQSKPRVIISNGRRGSWTEKTKQRTKKVGSAPQFFYKQAHTHHYSVRVRPLCILPSPTLTCPNLPPLLHDAHPADIAPVPPASSGQCRPGSHSTGCSSSPYTPRLLSSDGCWCQWAHNVFEIEDFLPRNLVQPLLDILVIVFPGQDRVVAVLVKHRLHEEWVEVAPILWHILCTELLAVQHETVIHKVVDDLIVEPHPWPQGLQAVVLDVIGILPHKDLCRQLDPLGGQVHCTLLIRGEGAHQFLCIFPLHSETVHSFVVRTSSTLVKYLDSSTQSTYPGSSHQYGR